MSVVLPLLNLSQRNSRLNSSSTTSLSVSSSQNNTPKAARKYQFTNFSPMMTTKSNQFRRSIDRFPPGQSPLDSSPSSSIINSQRKRHVSEYQPISAPQSAGLNIENSYHQSSIFGKPSHFMPPLDNILISRKSKPNLLLKTYQHKSSVSLDSAAFKAIQADSYIHPDIHLSARPKSPHKQNPLKLNCVMQARIEEEKLTNEESPSVQLILSPMSPTPKKHNQPTKEKIFNDAMNIPVARRSAINQHNKFSFADTRLFGEEALRDCPRMKYNSNYKKVEKIVDIDQHYQKESCIEVTMLKETIGKNVLPRRLGIVSSEVSSFVFPKANGKQKLDLSNQNIAQRYHEMVSSALSHGEMQGLYSIDLSSNNLNGDSLKTIAANLTTEITQVNVDKNNLGTSCAIGIIPLLDTKVFVSLRVLSLENNNISDLGLKSLVSALKANRSIYRLNLSSNRLTDVSGETLKAYLTESSYLQELYLHWNKIASLGALAIAHGLSDNRTLQVLDLSHNSIGVLKKMRAALQIIKSCSIKSTSMKHLDISFNMISVEETKDISTYLESSNQTLIGIHYEGNIGQAVFDPRGFLRLETTLTEPQSKGKEDQGLITHVESHVGMSVKHRINGFKYLGVNKIQSFDCLDVDNCWICDGWQEITFEIKKGCSDNFQGGPVFLHLDFENYRPHYMNPDENDPEKFVLHRMCPPNRDIHFFFSDPTQPILYFSKDYPSTAFKSQDPPFIEFYSEEERDKNKQKKPETSADQGKQSLQQLIRSRTKHLVKRYFKLQYLDTTVIEYIKPNIVNCIQTKSDKKVLKRGEYDPLVISKPREPETYYMITKTDQWTFEISLFQTYIRDSSELLDKCFEFDWLDCRLDKLISSCGDISLTKAVMKKYYAVYKNLYKYLSSVGMVGDIPCVTQNQYSNLLVRTQIIDGKKLKNSDGDISFVACNSGTINKEKNYRNPDKALVRYEFMEALGRLSIEKYARKDKETTAQDAFEILISDKFMNGKLLEIESQQDWRDQRYWNEDCDKILKKNLGLVKQLWETWADYRKTEKRYFMNHKTMSVFEFVDMVKFYDLLDERLTERDLYLSFNLAMMTQVDETTNDRFIQMTFVEFLESLARMAEKKSMIPIGEKSEDYTEDERKELHLSYKIESFLQEIIEKNENMNADKKGGNTQQKSSNNSVSNGARRSTKLPANLGLSSVKQSPRMSVASLTIAEKVPQSNIKQNSIFSKVKNELPPQINELESENKEIKDISSLSSDDSDDSP